MREELTKLRKKFQQQKEELAISENKRNCTQDSLKDLREKLEMVTKKLEETSEKNQKLKKELVRSIILSLSFFFLKILLLTESS